MKKYIALLSIIFIFCYIGRAFALEDDFLSKAISTAKEKAVIPQHYIDFFSSVEVEREQKLALLNWSGDTTRNSTGGSISVAVDDKNRIVGYNHYIYGNYYGDYKLSAIDYNQAAEKAKAATLKMCPEFANEVKVKPHQNYIARNRDNYTVTFYRNINGYPYYENYIEVNISAFNGEVFSLLVKWHDIDKISPPSSTIPSNKAKDNYFSKIGLKLGYQKNQNGESFLQYYTNFNGKEYINAYSGEKINSKYMQSETNSFKSYYYSDYFGEEEPLNAIPNEILERYLRSIPELNITEKYSLYNSSNSSFKTIMSFSADNGNESISVTINNETKEIISYYYASKVLSEGNLLSDEDCLKIATEFCQKYYIEKLNQCDNAREYVKYQQSPSLYSVIFTRKANGLPISGNGIDLTVNKLTGKIEMISLVWETNLSLPSASDVISPEQAYSKMISEVGLELQYVAVAKSGIANPKRISDLQLMLVYNFKKGKPTFVDAKTGQLTNEDGSLYFDRFENMYDDISWHALKNQIETLYYSGILPYVEQFRPDDVITQKEFFEFVFSALGYLRDYEDIYDTVYDRGIITPEERDDYKSITNEQGIKYIMQMLGYKDIAELKDTFKTGFVDEGMIDPSLIGYAAIAKGKGIFKGNAFMPKSVLTRAVTAEILYNLITS